MGDPYEVLKKSGTLCLEIPIPPSKNKKTTRQKYTGQTMMSNEVRQFYKDMKTYELTVRHSAKLFLTNFDIKKHMIHVAATLYQATMKTDIHNHNEFTCDALQDLLGVDDAYFVVENKPRLYRPVNREFMFLELTIIENPFHQSKKDYNKKEKVKK